MKRIACLLVIFLNLSCIAQHEEVPADFVNAGSKEELLSMFGNLKDEAKAVYDPEGKTEFAEMLSMVNTDKVWAEPARFTANAFVKKGSSAYVYVFSYVSYCLKAQNNINTNKLLSLKEQSIISIAALTAKSDLSKLNTALNAGLESGLTINQIKEVLVHLYAYCGFPRSIRGLQAFMKVLDERKTKGIKDEAGVVASSINQSENKYERGKKILGELLKAPQETPKAGYGAFAPVIDTFLKEHLFADIFERDVLTYTERELVTVSVLSAIGDAEPMLRSHLSICLNVGLTPGQLNEFVEVIRSTLGKNEAKNAKKVLDEVLKNTASQ